MPTARIVLYEPFQPARHIPIEPTPFIVGRTSTCQLVLQHPSISKEHAAIFDRDGNLFLRDLKSKNGTLINGMAAGETRLRDGDLISVGGVDILFQELDNRQRQSELKERLDRLSETLEWTATFQPNAALDQILDQVIAGLMQLSRADRGCLLLADDQRGLQIARSRGIHSRDLAVSGSLSSTALSKATDQRIAVVVSNAEDDSLYGKQASVLARGLKTLIAIPILGVEGKLLGLLYADSDTIEQTFTELDLQVLSSLAEGAALALESADLSRQIQRLVSRAADALAEVADETDLGETLQLSIHRTSAAMDRLTIRSRVDASDSGAGIP